MAAVDPVEVVFVTARPALRATLRRSGWLLALLVPAAAAWWLRPLFPPVETRYLDVAWEMWSRGHFLVPVLNGAEYSDKPPLFFWLVHLGWLAFGVSEWWPRAIPVLLAVANTLLAARLAVRLWPDDAGIGTRVAWLLAGTLSWLVFAMALMFDMLVTTCVLAGLLGLAEAGAGRRRSGFALYALAVGLGVLAKGPVILLHLLPTAVLAPWWLDSSVARRRWYAQVLTALAGASLLAAVWVVPAAVFGGGAYREKILWTQTAGRLSHSFAHARPWWFYFGVLPLLLLPWIAWLRGWRGVVQLVRRGDRGLRFLASGLIPAFAGFSAISGKQIHYLLPWVPGAMLLLAAGLRQVSEPLQVTQRITGAISLGVTVLLVAFVSTPAAARFDVKPAAKIIAAAAAAGAPLASTSAYNGEFGFFARLAVPVRNVGPDGVPGWCAGHPQGLVVDRREPGHPPRPDAAPVYLAPYRGHSLRLWSCSAAHG